MAICITSKFYDLSIFVPIFGVHRDFCISTIPVSTCKVAGIGARFQMCALCFKYQESCSLYKNGIGMFSMSFYVWDCNGFFHLMVSDF